MAPKKRTTKALPATTTTTTPPVTNAQIKALIDQGIADAYEMTWTNLKKMMTDKYCLRGEIKKLEVEMWNLKVKGLLHEKFYNSLGSVPNRCSVVWARLGAIYRSLEK
ncbi:hypothetical protein Tco_0113251 [Tanacetum coccineum]